MQLALFECTHPVADWRFFTTDPEGRWSPYEVKICLKCHKVFYYPDKDWLKRWPLKQQERLKEFLTEYGLQNPPPKNAKNNEQKTGEN